MRGHDIPASGVTHTFILHSMTVCPHVSILEREKCMEHFRENAWRGGMARVRWLIGNASEENQPVFQRRRDFPVPLRRNSIVKSLFECFLNSPFTPELHKSHVV